MAIKQIVPIFITLQGDGSSTTFVYAVQNIYQASVSSSIPFGAQGVVPSSAVANNPPVPVSSVTVDANGNLTITLSSALGNGVQATFEIDLIYNSGSATSSSPTTASLVTLTGVSTVTVSGTTAVSGTVAATQSGTWNVGVTGTVAVTQSGTWTVGLSTGSNTIGAVTQASGPWTINETQLAGVALGAPSNYGTSPGAVAVQGVNAYVTNTVPVTLTSTTITGTVAVTQSTTPWVTNMTQWGSTTLGTPTNFGTTPGAVIAGSVNASLFAGTTALSQTGGSLNVNITGGGSSGTQYANGTAVATPTGTVAMGWDGANVRALSTTTAGALYTLGLTNSNTSLATWTSGTALNTTAAVTNSSDYGTIALGFLCNSGTFSTGVISFEGSLDNSNWTALTGIQPNGTTSSTIILATSTYTVYVFHATPYPFFRVRLSTAITGTGQVTIESFAASNSSTEGVSVYGSVIVTNMPGATSPGGSAPGSGLYILGSVTSAAPAYTTATVNALSLDTSGNLRTLAVQSGTWNVGVTGTVAVTQSTSPWVVSLTSTTVTNTVAVNETQINGVALGSPSNFGTSPGAISVQGVNASLFSGTTALTNTGGSLNVNITGGSSGNAAASATGSAVPASADYQGLNVGGTLRGQTGTNPTGTVYAAQTDLTSANGVSLGSPSAFGTSPGAVNVIGTNASLFIGTTAAVASAAGVQKVGISGAAGATMDVIIGGATAAANALQVAGVYNSTQPTFTTGQAGALQMDNRGNLLVNTLSGSTVGSAVGTNAMQTGINVGGTLRIWTGVNPTGTVYSGQVDVASVAGTTVSTAAAGIMKVGVVGATGATWDTAIGPSTAAANAVQVAGVYNSGGITLTTGQGAALQVDSHGSLLVELSPNNPTSNMTGTVPATAPGYTTIVGGIYNSTAPTATTGQTLPLQTDTAGSQYVNQEGRKATYRACVVAYTLLASSTIPCIYVTGSSTKTVRITKVRFSASAGTGTACDVTLRRYASLSGGGFGTGNITTSELDTPNPSSTATVHAVTSAITTVTGATVLACERYEIVTAAVSVQPGLIEWNFGIANDQALVLRGTSDFVGITVSAVGTTPVADVWIEWTEE